MKCPYCKNEVNDSELFCTVCGQALSGQTHNGKSTQVYWEEYQKKSDKEVSHSRVMTELTKKQNRKARNAIFICVFICCAILCTIAILIISKNMTNKKVLEDIHEQMIGKVYYDSEDNILWSGDDTDRCVITILDQDQLEFIEGNYKMRLDSGNHMTWTENEIYQNETYTYSLSISFFGKVFITIQGEKYEVDVWDDGSVNMIHIYED